MLNNNLSLVLTLLFTLGFSIAAQTGSSSLIVSVTDQFGNIVTGASVNAVNPKKISRIVVTNDNGSANFRKLDEGIYQITITVAGFKEYRSGDILVKPGELKKLTIVLDIAEIETKVDVSENEGTEMGDKGATKTLGQEQIDRLPDDPDQMKKVLQRMAGESVTGEELPITVNGIPGGQMPAKADIKLVRVNRNVFSAQYENTYGGGIEIFTNSNAKKISGWANFNFADSRINATDPLIGVRVPSQSRNLSYGISGPLGKKAKLSLYSFLNDSKSSSVVNAVVLDANLRPQDFKQTYDDPRRFAFMNLTFDSDPNKKHKVVFTYNLRGSHFSNGDVGGFSLPSRATATDSSDHTINFSDTYIINPNFVHTTRFVGRISKNTSLSRSAAAAINVAEAFQGGGSQTDRVSSNSAFEIYSDTTRKFDKLSIGFGVMFRGQTVGETSRSNFGGTYNFSGRIAPVLDANNLPVKDPTGNTVTAQISSLESYRRTLLFRQLGFASAAIRVLGGGADQFTIAGGAPELNVGQFDYAFYQQNSYSLTQTVGISFGVRYENQTNIKSRSNFSPRFGVIWAPKAKEKQSAIWALPRVTVGYGFFYSRFRINGILSARQANDTGRSLYFITDPAILDVFPAVPSISTLQQNSTLRSLRLIAGDLQTPRLDLFNINVNKKLWAGFTTYFTYSNSHGRRQTLTRNINAPLVGTISNPVYPYGNSRSIYESRSEGRTSTNRVSASLGFPDWKIKGKETYMSLNYSFAKNRSDVVSGSSSPNDPYDFSREFGPASNDGVHSVGGYMSFGLPKGFFISGNFDIQTGTRFNITTGRDTNKDSFYSERPAFAKDPNKPGVVQTPYGALDPNPSPGDNIIPRNLARGPITREFDIYFGKGFGFYKDKANKNAPRRNLSFHISIDNVFNFNNKGNPIGNMSSPNFLRTISGSSYDGSFSRSQPRQFSFGTSFSF